MYILRFILKLLSWNGDYNCSAVLRLAGKDIEWFVDDVEEGGSSSEVGLDEEVVEKIRIGDDVVRMLVRGQ